MSEAHIFNKERTADSVAWDLALVIASKDSSLTTPEDILNRIIEVYPSCLKVAEARRSHENPPLKDLDVLLL